MTREELHVWVDAELGMCGCGNPEKALESLRAMLRLHPLHADAGHEKLHELVADDGLYWLLLYRLDQLGLTEHGGLISGGWLTERGKEILEALEALGDSVGVEEFSDEEVCAHGRLLDLDCSACAERLHGQRRRSEG